ncbi:hypothetical protein V1512DRAFT_117487 [Lipomyces arxii]|uniref:uncharacterized protein n=1 Tax=Lipomyces arxii TaxID=56418 RepID=UPI0034CF3958
MEDPVVVAETNKREIPPSVESGDPPAKKVKQEDARDKGVSKIKPEYLLAKAHKQIEIDDDDAEAGGKSRVKKERGQNKGRKFAKAQDSVRFCNTIQDGESVCKFGAECRYEHDVQKYIDSKPPDLGDKCPVYEEIGYCPSGLKCRWLHSHLIAESLKLVMDEEKKAKAGYEVNRISRENQTLLQKKKFPTPKSNVLLPYLDALKDADMSESQIRNGEEKAEAAAAYVEPPLQPSEKQTLNLDRKMILSPLTTVGNLPFRRMCRYYGAEVTYSEMALALPLLQGSKGEWALPRTHSSERGGFGIQIAAPKLWQSTKATEVLTATCEEMSEINLNCGCPIDLVYRSGAGSALLDSQAKLLRMLKGMNTVSGQIPVTAKIRMGTRDNHPNAKKLVTRMITEGDVAAITLHGRSRQQRYTRSADWKYIGETAKIVRDMYEEHDEKEKDRDRKKVWFIGNGDCYSWKDWVDAVDEHGVDSVMVARGALIKPWIFEEIQARQYLDKSATQRLDIIKTFANYGLEHWGTDEYGINNCRRYLCEYLSFSYRYVPEGILEVLPARLQDRPPLWRGRNDLETLLGSGDYRDWIKISEMFLGPVHESFDFKPKHKSNAYEGQG